MKKVEIKGTPFTIIQEEEKEAQIVIGNQIVSDKSFKTIKDAKQHINKKPWDLIMVAAMICTEHYISTKNTEK